MTSRCIRDHGQAARPRWLRRRSVANGSTRKSATSLSIVISLFGTTWLAPSGGPIHRITRGRPELRTLRDIMDEVYRLFDRRCRTDTVLENLAKLRRRVCRFKKVGKTLHKLFSPNLEKSLTFLDDKLLPSTSNAVERGYRRHRKMQKTVYRIRTQRNINGRIALDMQREERTQHRAKTTKTLHTARPRKAA